MNNYKLQAPYEPNGDQPEAIKKLVKGVNNGKQFQTLLGATGTGKTFTIANVCLLYTSPSPRDPKTSRMPSSA